MKTINNETCPFCNIDLPHDKSKWEWHLDGHVSDTKNTQHIQTELEKLGNYCLEHAETKSEYTDNDLVNATLIFTEVLNSKMYDYYVERGYDHELRKELAKYIGYELRDFIKKATGIDMHKVVSGQVEN